LGITHLYLMQTDRQTELGDVTLGWMDDGWMVSRDSDGTRREGYTEKHQRQYTMLVAYSDGAVHGATCLATVDVCVFLNGIVCTNERYQSINLTSGGVQCSALRHKRACSHGKLIILRVIRLRPCLRELHFKNFSFGFSVSL
jgi:hypothetical protein